MSPTSYQTAPPRVDGAVIVRLPGQCAIPISGITDEILMRSGYVGADIVAQRPQLHPLGGG